MKQTIATLLVLCVTALNTMAQEPSASSSTTRQALTGLLKKYTSEGLPGVGIALCTGNGDTWVHAEGLASIEDSLALTGNHLHYLQSITKTYMAVAVLKLYEEGKIGLDAPVLTYLGATAAANLQGIGKVTVKMLLNHTSGLAEYSTAPQLASQILNNPHELLTAGYFLSIVKNTPPAFEAGSHYKYTNTNYLLLSMIIDKVTGSHEKYLVQMLKEAGLNDTHYLTAKNYKKIKGITASYWDILNVGRPAQVTALQKANVASLRGDDGMVSTTADAVKFLKSLLEGRLLKKETVTLMQQWVNNDNGQPAYGLGLTRYDLGQTYGIGHSGGGLGAGCVLIYLPAIHTYVFLATNINTLIEGSIAKKAYALQMEVLTALFTN